MAFWALLLKIGGVILTILGAVSSLTEFIARKLGAILAAHKFWAIFFFAGLIILVFNILNRFLASITDYLIDVSGVQFTPNPLVQKGLGVLDLVFPVRALIETVSYVFAYFVYSFVLCNSAFVFRRFMRYYHIIVLGAKI